MNQADGVDGWPPPALEPPVTVIWSTGRQLVKPPASCPQLQDTEGNALLYL